jgi:outer membrane protein OmpA-like peptidoglycan-associated protein/uncharacterized membrane protein (UPF0127 family)
MPSQPTSLHLKLARTYWQRLRGLLFRPALAVDQGLWIEPCHSVHTFGMRYAIDVVYLDAQGCVIKVAKDVKPWRMSWARGAASVIELLAGGADRLGLTVGQPLLDAGSAREAAEEGAAWWVTMAPSRASRSERGASAVEMAVMLPAALFAVLLVMQGALVYHAKGQANLAAMSAARAGSMAHATESSLRLGFAKGLVPLMGGGGDASEIAAMLIQAGTQAALADIEILSPNREAFDDYPSALAAQRLRDEGMTVDEPVIQNMSIAGLSCPWVAAGATAACQPDPATNASGQSLQDANLLKVRITWGIPASKQVPLAGPAFAQAIRGLTALGLMSHAPRTMALVASSGVIPVTVTATVRMQTEPIRNSLMASRDRSAPLVSGRASGVFTALAVNAAASAPAAAPSTPEPRPTTDRDGNPIATTLPNEPATNPNAPPNPFPDGNPPATPPAPAPAPNPNPTPPPEPAPAPPAVCAPNDANCNRPLPAECPTGTLVETGDSSIFFDFDSSELTSGGRAALDRYIASAREETFETLTVTGYTDQLGNASHNQTLSERRANVVRRYLIDNGLRGNIVAVGRGAEDPLVPLSSCPAGPTQVACLAPNRRVVFTMEGIRR